MSAIRSEGTETASQIRPGTFLDEADAFWVREADRWDGTSGQFGDAMAAGPHADTFRVLARSGQSGGLIDLASIQSRVKEVGTFQKFLAGQRGAGSAPVVN